MRESQADAGWLRRILGRDRYRILPEADRLPKVGNTLKLGGPEFDEETPLFGQLVLACANWPLDIGRGNRCWVRSGAESGSHTSHRRRSSYA